MLVLDQRLRERRFAVDDVDQVIDDAPLAAHDQVQIAQADVKIDDGRFEATQCEAGREAGTGRGFAHTTLAGSDNNNTSQGCVSVKKAGFYPLMRISPNRRAW